MSCAHTGLPRWLSGKESTRQCKKHKRPLGQKDPLEEEMTAHSSILAWKTPWTEESGRLQSMGVTKELDTTKAITTRRGEAQNIE